MKKTILSSVLLASLSLALTGCGSQPANNSANGNSSSTGQPSGAPQAGNRGDRRMPDFGQPKTEPDVRGIIKTIVGNEVDILKIDMQRRNATSTDPAGAAAKTGTARASLSIGGGMPAGGPGGMGGGRQGGEGFSETSRAEMLKKLKEMSTGEEKVIIPVGIKMLKASDTKGKREMVEASLSDLAADKSITIWLNKSVTDKKVAEFVLVN